MCIPTPTFSSLDTFAAIRYEMVNQVFNLAGRRAYVDLFSAPDSVCSLFMRGNGGNAYGEIDGRAVWIHGTFGDDQHSGVDGQYYEVAIDRNKALRNLFPSIEIVGKPRLHSSPQSLASARNWVRNSSGAIALFTYCNLNVSFCRSMAYGRPGLQYARWSGLIEKEWVANQIWGELISASQPQADSQTTLAKNWVRLKHKTAQHIANLGGFVVACSYNSTGFGHLVFLTEDLDFDYKTYDESSQGLQNCLSLKCFHCGSGKPRITDLIRVFPCLNSYEGCPRSLLDSVRLYCDLETWTEYASLTNRITNLMRHGKQ
jgi:hypothetical protein